MDDMVRLPTPGLDGVTRPLLGIDVDAPGELAWQQLVDLDQWPRWGPTVKAARLDGHSRILSAGATGKVQPVVGPWLPFEVTSLRDDGPTRSWSWRVAGVHATEHVVIDRGPSACRVEMSVPLLGVPYLSVVGVALTRIRRFAEDAARD